MSPIKNHATETDHDDQEHHRRLVSSPSSSLSIAAPPAATQSEVSQVVHHESQVNVCRRRDSAPPCFMHLQDPTAVMKMVEDGDNDGSDSETAHRIEKRKLRQQVIMLYIKGKQNNKGIKPNIYHQGECLPLGGMSITGGLSTIMENIYHQGELLLSQRKKVLIAKKCRNKNMLYFLSLYFEGRALCIGFVLFFLQFYLFHVFMISVSCFMVFM